MDLRGEKDIEQLRRVALAQQVQIEQLIKALARKCKELEKLTDNGEELQQTLALIETLTEKAKTAAEVASNPSKDDKPRKARTQFGPPSSRSCPSSNNSSSWTQPIAHARAAAASFARWSTSSKRRR